MNLYGTSPIKRTRRTHVNQESLDAELYVVSFDPPMTVLQVFYQATLRGLLPKHEAKGCRVVQRRFVDLREAGVIPYDWITNNAWMVRSLKRYTAHENFAARSAQLYRRDSRARSDVRVEVLPEKDALAGVLYPVVVSEWGLELFVTRGFASVSYLESAAAAARMDGRPTFIYVLTNLDLSGIEIACKVAQEPPRRTSEVEMSVRRLAVTLEQVEVMSLPTRPTKQTDTRAKKIQARYGTESVELDAISPSTLQQMGSDAIARHADTEEHSRLKRIEQLERNSLIQGLGFGRGRE